MHDVSQNAQGQLRKILKKAAGFELISVTSDNICGLESREDIHRFPPPNTVTESVSAYMLLEPLEIDSP